MPPPPPPALTATTPALLLLPGPVRLVQGNVGFIARYPVYLPFTNLKTGATAPATLDDAGMYGTVGNAGSGFYGSGNTDLGITRVASGEWSPFECGTACYNTTHYLWCATAACARLCDAPCPPPTLLLSPLVLSNRFLPHSSFSHEFGLSPCRARAASFTPPPALLLALLPPPCPCCRGITSSALDFVELLKVSGLQNLDRRGYDYRLVKLANATTGNTTWVTGACHHRSCPPHPRAPARVAVRTPDQTSDRCQNPPKPCLPRHRRRQRHL